MTYDWSWKAVSEAADSCNHPVVSVVSHFVSTVSTKQTSADSSSGLTSQRAAGAHPLRAAGLETALLWVSGVVVVVFEVAVVSVVVVALMVVAYFLRRCLPVVVVSVSGSRTGLSITITHQSLSNSSNSVSKPLGRTADGAAKISAAESASRVAQRLAQSTCGSSHSLSDATGRAIDGLASNWQALADIANGHDTLLTDIADSVQRALSCLADGTESTTLALSLALALLSLESLLLLLESLLLLALGEDLVCWDHGVLRIHLLLLRGCLGLRHGLLDSSLWLLR